MHVEVKNLSFARGGQYLFRNLNFNLSPGQMLIIQGHNGSGKSTLLKILAGLILPNKGCVSWGNQKIVENDQFLRDLAYLGHRDGLNLGLNAKENIKVLLALGDQVLNQNEMTTLLEKLDLSDHLARPCQKLSAGQKRKVALCAIALKRKPLWILDEPYTSLDDKSIGAINQLMKNHLSNNGMIIMASHIHLQQDNARVIQL